jgi:hypothetical protein
MEEKNGQETENDETLHDEDTNENSDNVAQSVGHNMYILAYQVYLQLNHLEFFTARYRKFDIYLKSLCFHVVQQMENHSQVQNIKTHTHPHRKKIFFLMCNSSQLLLYRDHGK